MSAILRSRWHPQNKVDSLPIDELRLQDITRDVGSLLMISSASAMLKPIPTRPATKPSVLFPATSMLKLES